MSKRIHMATRLPGASVARAKIIRADGTIEDKGIISIQLRWWNPKDWYKVIRNIVRFGYGKSKN